MSEESMCQSQAEALAEMVKTETVEIIAEHVAAERERCAKIAEAMPDRVLVMYDRPGSPPGNTYVHVSGQKLIANAIRNTK